MSGLGRIAKSAFLGKLEKGGLTGLKIVNSGLPGKKNKSALKG